MDNNASNYPGPSALQVFVNGNSQGTFSNNTTTANQNNWQKYSFEFQASVASNTVLFQNVTATCDNMAGLDDAFIAESAEVSTTSGDVPEPATFGMMGLAAGALALMARRRA